MKKKVVEQKTPKSKEITSIAIISLKKSKELMKNGMIRKFESTMLLKNVANYFEEKYSLPKGCIKFGKRKKMRLMRKDATIQSLEKDWNED